VVMNLDIGVIRPVVPRSQMPWTIGSAAAFAAAIAQRYAPQAVMVTRADLAVAWQAPDQVTYATAAQRIDIAPTVTVEEHNNVFIQAARDVAAASGVEQVNFGEAEASALFARLFSRQGRVATFAAAAAAAPLAAASANPFVVGPRDLVESAAAVERSLPLAPMDGDRPMRHDPVSRPHIVHRDDGWGTPPMLPPEPKPITLPAPEIRRVAEQVMREIDHHITAHRERLGKR
jgi:hypothetical protein